MAVHSALHKVFACCAHALLTQSCRNSADLFAEVCDCLQPTQQLQRFFTACDYDMTDLVAARIEQMAQAVFPLVPSSEHALQALQAAMNNERRQQVHP